MTSIAQRAQLVVDRIHGGSVNAAARALRMPHSSLGKILSGEVTSPRGKTFEKFAELYGGSMDWWTRGQGPAPAILHESEGNPLPQAELLEWQLLRKKLGTQATEAALANLPLTIANAALHLGIADELPTRKRKAVNAEIREAIRYGILGWIKLLETMVAVRGVDATRTALEQNRAALERGFVDRFNVSTHR